MLASLSSTDPPPEDTLPARNELPVGRAGLVGDSWRLTGTEGGMLRGGPEAAGEGAGAGAGAPAPAFLAAASLFFLMISAKPPPFGAAPPPPNMLAS